MALYADLFRRNVTVDFARPDDDLSHYRLVVAPHLYMVSDHATQNIEQYMASGGTLLMTFFSGIVDSSEHVRLGGYPVPFRTLLGLWIEEFAPYAEAEPGLIELDDGRQLTCDLWSDVIHLEGAEVLARFCEGYFAGSPAITRHRFGQGTGYYLSTSLRQDGLSWLLERVFADADLQPVRSLPRGVEMTRRSDGNLTWLFLLNYSEEPAQVKLAAEGIDLVTGAKTRASLVLEPKGVAIVQILHS
jgi:beta-galactosidase